MSKGTVYILHGLESSSHFMKPFESAFTQAGYKVHNSTWSASRRPFKVIAEEVRSEINLAVGEGEKVHFVCHSLGGLLIRYAIKKGLHCTVGRVVTMSSPHKGAEWVEEIPYGRKIGNFLFGKDLVDSLMDFEYINTLPQLTPYRVLTVTASKKVTAYNPVSWLAGNYIDGDNDGFVKKSGMTLIGADTVDFELDHVFMIFDKGLIAYVLQYIGMDR